MNFIAGKHFQKPWLIKQRWSDVLFYHFMMDPTDLQKLVPFKLDLYENQAFVSIVPFKMSGIEINGVPKFITKWSKLWEINLRTYVIVDGVPGIYFFTLDATSLLGVMIAKLFFNLPYHYSQCSMKSSPSHQGHFHHSRSSYSFSTRFKITEPKLKNEVDLWLTERYNLFTKRKNRVYQGIVTHIPWPLRNVEVLEMKDQFSKMIGKCFEMHDIINPSYCDRLDVSFQPFQRI